MPLEDNIYLISGTDESAITKRASEIVAQVAGSKPDAFSLDIIKETDDITSLDAVRQTINSVLSPPFMGGRKTVWLKNFPAFSAAKKSATKGTVGGALNRLAEIIEKGIPNDICLVMDGPGLDRRKRLYKLCESSGMVEFYEKLDARRDRNWQNKVANAIKQQAREKGVKLSRDVLDYLVTAIGTDTARIESELEKLATFGNSSEYAPELTDVRALCPAEAETVPWVLWEAVGRRSAAQAMEILGALLHNENNPDSAVLGIALQTAGFVRDMLQVKVLMFKQKLRNPAAVDGFLKSQATPETKQKYLDNGIEVVNYHPYRARKLAENSSRFKGTELVNAVVRLKNVCRTCVTGDSSNRAAFEHALIEICGQ